MPGKVCPAYQSYFMIDPETKEDFFAMFDQDSLPRDRANVKKNRYGLIKEITYVNKSHTFNTVKKEKVYIPMPTVEDSTDFQINIPVDGSEPSAADSLYASSKMLPINIGWPGYNVDQLYYNELYGDLLIPQEKEKSQEELEQEEREILSPQERRQLRREERRLAREEEKRKKEEEAKQKELEEERKRMQEEELIIFDDDDDDYIY